MLKAPRRIASRTIASYPYLALREHDVVDEPDAAALERGSQSAQRLALTLDLFDWCVVAAMTTDRRWVMVEQHRHGVDGVTLEPAGGIIDEGEAPRRAAERELLEETGYGGGSLRDLGWVHPNPALSGNRAHLFFASGVREIAPIQQRPDEVTRAVLLDHAELEAALAEGRVSAALAVVALMRALRASPPTGQA